MDIALFREFIVTAQSRSLNEAAKKLFISTPTLSRHLAEIEKKVGSTLIRRDGMDFSLTPQGEVFLENAFALAEAYDKTITVSKAQSGGNWPKVTIGGNLRVNAANIIAMNAISHLTHTRAMVAPRIFDQHTHGSYVTASKMSDPIQAMRQGEVDVSLLVDSKEARELFHVEEVWSEPLLVALPENHHLAQGEEPVSLSKLRNDRLGISVFPPDLYQAEIDACRELGFDPATHRRICQSRASMFVNLDDHVFFLVPEHDVPRMAPTSLSGLVVKELVEPIHIDFLIARNEEVPDWGVQAVIDALKKAAETLGKGDLSPRVGEKAR